MKKKLMAKDIEKLRKHLKKIALPTDEYILLSGGRQMTLGTLIGHIKPEVMRKVVLFAIRSGMNLNTGEFDNPKEIK